MMFHPRLGRFASASLLGALVAWLPACGDRILEPPGSRTVPAPGVHSSPPPGVHAVRGECKGRIALTPLVPHSRDSGHPYPLVYDCAAKTFEVLPVRTDLVGMSDLTLTPDGYYLHQSRFIEGAWRGGYQFHDRDGNVLRALKRPDDPKVHDLVVHGDFITYARYAPDWDAARCGRHAPLELEIATDRVDGAQVWRWSSRGRFDPGHGVATDRSIGLPTESAGRRWMREIRHCYTSIARRVLAFDTPAGFLRPGRWALFRLELDDYLHANSLQHLEPAGDILVSARHLDTLFIVERATGRLAWSLGGPFAKATAHRPEGDPRGGFSHPHHARIEGNTLWVFDNANLTPDLPSRVVAYQTDSKPRPNRMLFEFPEPNGRQRYALGSVQPLPDGHVLVGWGGIRPADRKRPQRAVSVFRVNDGREVFQLDLSPGWISYRAKAAS